MRKVTVEGVGTYDVNENLSDSELRRLIGGLSGASWVSSSTVCRETDGSISFKRPAAAPKG